MVPGRRGQLDEIVNRWKEIHQDQFGAQQNKNGQSFLKLRYLYKLQVYNTVIYYFFFLFAISWAAVIAYGGSQARGRIGATAASLDHSHSNKGSKPHLRPTPQLTAKRDR